MIGVLESIGNFIVTFWNLFTNFWGNFFQFLKVIGSFLAFGASYWVLLPGWLLIFVMLYVGVYVINRILNGRN